MMVEHQLKIQRYKQALAQWEEEFRCYGPQGTIASNFSDLTQKDLNKLRSLITKLETMSAALEREHENVRRFIYDSNF
jgi:predicted  nucleic acid-binding Zn-ribbon protein